ncbi:MAG: BTAD domain-containing putative transcriptional regulator [Pseudonocardiales bacterium]
MRVRVLGAVELVDDSGMAMSVGSPTQRLVLAALAAQPGVTVSADALIDAIWGDQPPRSAADSLRTYVSRLRRHLGDALVSRAGGYALPAGSVDAERFEDLVRRARTTDPATSIALLDQALELWRGAPFGELADVELLRGVAVRLDELHLAARELRATALAAAGRVGEAVAAAEELLAGHPLREGAWVVLIEALAAAGRVPDAMTAYRRGVAALDEAGLDPSEALRAAQTAALSMVPQQPRWLPVPAASLIGRERELAELAELVDKARVVTLVGPGGVGKTRLVIEAANALAGRFARGARLVELAGLRDPDAVVAALVGALGLAADAGSPQKALSRAGALDLLVVVDNCEHVVDAAARAVDALVRGGPVVRVLATSRERLGIDGEHVLPVAPLEVFPSGDVARALFLDRLRAVRGGAFAGSQPDLTQVDRIVARVDGLPLGIEMAAARAATLPLAELADRLSEHLGLLGQPRAGAARHRTLAAVVEWSEALLDPDDRALFAELATFAGPVGADDVAVVTGHPAPLKSLCHLAERCLVIVDTEAPRARFGMLSTIRTHAAARLAGTPRGAQLARRHAEHLVDVAAAADRELRRPAESAAHARFEELIDEFRIAHARLRSSDPALAGELSTALYLFAMSRQRDEPLSWACELIAGWETSSPSAIGALASVAIQAATAGELTRAQELAERALASARSDPERILPLDVLTDVHLYAGRLDDCTAVSRQLLAVSGAAADLHGTVVAITNLACVQAYAGRPEQAERLLATERPADAELAPSDRGWLAYTEGEVVLDRDPQRALPALDRAIALADSVGNRFLGGAARLSACSLRSRCGDAAEALAAFAAVIDHWRRQGDLVHQLTTLRNLVVLFQRVGAAAEAAELLGAVDAATLSPTFGTEAARLAVVRDWVRTALGEAAAQRHRSIGATRDVGAAADVALTHLATLK